MMRLHARGTRWFFPAVPVPVLILQQLPPRRSPSGHSQNSTSSSRLSSSLSPREEEPNHPPLHDSWYSLWTRHPSRSPLL